LIQFWHQSVFRGGCGCIPTGSFEGLRGGAVDGEAAAAAACTGVVGATGAGRAGAELLCCKDPLVGGLRGEAAAGGGRIGGGGRVGGGGGAGEARGGGGDGGIPPGGVGGASLRLDVIEWRLDDGERPE